MPASQPISHPASQTTSQPGEEYPDRTQKDVRWEMLGISKLDVGVILRHIAEPTRTALLDCITFCTDEGL